jgi:hypothetical protein
MAKLIDPDSLSLAVNTTATTEEVEIQTGPKTVELRIAGNLDDTSPGKDSGVTGRCVYSFLKEEWLTNSTLRRFKFPIQMIFEGSFIWVNGWAPANVQTRDLIRDAGFEEQVTGDTYACMISLGTINDPLNDLAYYTQSPSFTAAVSNYDKTGELNENINITGADTYKKTFLRIEGKRYAEYSLLTEQGLSVLNFQAYSFPLQNSIDDKIQTTDANVDTLAPYTGMTITYLQGVGFTTYADATLYPANSVVLDGATGRWFFTDLGGTSSGANVAADAGVTWVAYEGEVLIGSIYYAFNRIVDANGGTDLEAYTYMQRQLRQTGDINDDVTTDPNQGGFGAVNGNVAELMGSYVGDILELAPGVALVNFNSNSTNNIRHAAIDVDSGGLDSVTNVPLSTTQVDFPFVSAGNFIFSENYVTQPDNETVYTVYFRFVTRTTSSGLAVTSATGSNATLDWTGDAAKFNFLSNGDYIFVSGFTNAVNNGLYLVTGAPTSNTVTVTKQNGVTLVDEVAGPTIQVDLNPYESPGAVIVNNNAGTPLDGQITTGTTAWDFDYTNNNQGGRTPGTNAECVVVALALDGAQWVDANFTISAATGINVPVNGGDERNYSNPI